MITYGKLNSNYRIDRVEQTNEKIVKSYNKVKKIVDTLTDKQFDELYTAIGDYVWGFDMNANKADFQTAKAIIKRYGLTYKQAEIYYCHDED